jgi:hypothetical protein
MKNYLILLCFAISITLYGMQKDVPLPMYAFNIVDANTYDISQLEKFATTQLSDVPDKKILIIDNKQECLSIDDYISPYYTPQQTTLHNIDFSQYSLALYMIKPTIYNQTTKKFDSFTEKAIDLLANSKVKTYYYILLSNNCSGISPILDKINVIYLQADAKKTTYSQQNPFVADLFKRCKQCKQRLSRLIASLGKKMTSVPILCLIIRFTDHPAFPLPSVRPFILNSLHLVIMLKTFLA